MSRKNKKKTGNGAGAISFGTVFLILAGIFGFSGLIKLLVFLGLSAAIGSVVRIMAQGLDTTTLEQKRQMEEEAKKAEEAEKRRKADVLEQIKGQTGSTEVDELLTRGRSIIQQIRRENALIPDESLSAKLDTLERMCGSIFQAVYADPSKAGQIRKFMDYYLPTTLKMVRSYRMIDERNVAIEEAQSAKKRIDDALGVVNSGCQKMLRNLYKEDMLDITTDIDVLEQMLKRDGLTESDLELAAQQAKQAAKLDAELMRQRQQAQARQAAQVQPVQQAQTTPAQPVPTFDSGVKTAVGNAYQQAQQHVPQAPTLTGTYYPTYGGQAMAQAPDPRKNNQ